jgi:hypothetical protein
MTTTTRMATLTPDDWRRSGQQASYVMPWLDTTEPKAVGEGLTRTAAPAARLFPMLLTFTNAAPMRTEIRAISWSQAEKFARNRHPNLSAIERLQQTAIKP